MSSVIETHDLIKTYRNSTALDGVTLSLEPGKIYGLLGRNGAGKTTLMSILTAQGFQTSGSVRSLAKAPTRTSAC